MLDVEDPLTGRPGKRNYPEIASRERALHLAQAAEEIGGFTVRALGNVGETYDAPDGLRIVPEGQIHIQVESKRPDTSELHRRADELGVEARSRPA